MILWCVLFLPNERYARRFGSALILSFFFLNNLNLRILGFVIHIAGVFAQSPCMLQMKTRDFKVQEKCSFHNCVGASVSSPHTSAGAQHESAQLSLDEPLPCFSHSDGIIIAMNLGVEERTAKL